MCGVNECVGLCYSECDHFTALGQLGFFLISHKHGFITF